MQGLWDLECTTMVRDTDYIYFPNPLLLVHRQDCAQPYPTMFTDFVVCAYELTREALLHHTHVLYIKLILHLQWDMTTYFVSLHAHNCK